MSDDIERMEIFTPIKIRPPKTYWEKRKYMEAKERMKRAEEELEMSLIRYLGDYKPPKLYVERG